MLDVSTPRLRPGRVRLGLDEDISAARKAGTRLPGAGVGLLRSLADQLDALERSLRHPGTRPYDRVPLKQLTDAFQETYAYVFAGAAADTDPIGAALAAFLATEPATAGGGAAHDDTAHTGSGQ